jgi:hypothetical protein
VSVRDDRAMEWTLRQLGQRADARPAESNAAAAAHVEEPVLALLRNGDHGDDLGDAIAHVARCPDCRARLTAGEVRSRALVVVAIEAPSASQIQLEQAAEFANARLVERGRGRWTAVVDADRAETLKSKLEGEQSVVSRLVVGTPLDVSGEDVSSSGERRHSMHEIVPRERGTEAAEVSAWAQMRRQPKRRVGGASPGWALFALAAVGGAAALAYWLALR